MHLDRRKRGVPLPGGAADVHRGSEEEKEHGGHAFGLMTRCGCGLRIGDAAYKEVLDKLGHRATVRTGS